MNATKRKFNALLQGLSNPRTDSRENSSQDMIGNRVASSKNVDAEALLQKRRRLGFPESTAPRLDSSISMGISSLTGSLKRSVMKHDPKGRKDVPAKYSPGDRDELLRRLATFQEITDWTPKPDRINEVEWAKRGWVCQGKETVRCLLCHKELVVKLNRKEVDGKEADATLSSEIEEALVNKYAEMIVNYHQSDCLWKRRGCDDALLRLSFVSAKAAIEALRQRYHELCSRQSFLPYEFNLRLPEDMNLEEVVSQLPPDFFATEKSSENSSNTPNRPALALALLGWQGLTNARIGAVPNSASCHTCLRRLGLWMFKSKEVDENGQVLVPAPMDHLDPVREHRFFCPWKSAGAQSRGNMPPNDVALPAWKILLQSIKNESSLRRVYEGRTKAPSSTSEPKIATPSTPVRPQTQPRADATAEHTTATTMATETPTATATTMHVAPELYVNYEDEAVRDAKDKERWARLRKVKSLFDTKKLRKSISRPGTPHSTKSTKD